MKIKYVWIILLLATLFTLYYYDYHKNILKKFDFLPVGEFLQIILNAKDESVRLFTNEEIRVYTNLENGLYLAILGNVYDVTKGEKHYGPEGSYRAFVGEEIQRLKEFIS